MPGTARIGAIEITGFDGQSTIASAAPRASSTPGAGRARVGALVADRDDGRLRALAHEPFLHAQLAGSAGSRP